MKKLVLFVVMVVGAALVHVSADSGPAASSAGEPARTEAGVVRIAAR